MIKHCDLRKKAMFIKTKHPFVSTLSPRAVMPRAFTYYIRRSKAQDYEGSSSRCQEFLIKVENAIRDCGRTLGEKLPPGRCLCAKDGVYYRHSNMVRENLEAVAYGVFPSHARQGIWHVNHVCCATIGAKEMVMRTFLAIAVLGSALFISGCGGNCGDDTACSPPPPPPRPAPVVRPAPPRPPPPPPAVCDPCAGF